MLFNLKVALQKKYRTIYQAARHLGISETRLSRIIAERVTPKTDEKKKIVEDVASMPEAELFARTEVP